MKRRTKVSKKGVLRKAVLMCDRGKEHIDENGGKRNTTSRKTNCLFDAIAILEEEGWSYRLRNGDHNHDPTLAGAYPAHRKIARTEDVLDQIANHAQTGAPPQQTLTHLRLGQNPENPLIKNRDVYNKRQRIQERNLDGLTPIRALMRTLFDTESWFVRYYPHLGPVERLFFAGRLSERISKISWDVILLDCTYKTNHYRMPLCVISGVTGLNTSFYIGFAFVSFETYTDYRWVLSCLREFYVEGDIPDPIFAGTNCEKALIRALEIVFPRTEHGLCIWHVDKNVLANCKPSFDTEEAWEAFYDDWHKVLYASTEPLFEEKWADFEAKYDADY